MSRRKNVARIIALIALLAVTWAVLGVRWRKPRQRLRSNKTNWLSQRNMPGNYFS